MLRHLFFVAVFVSNLAHAQGLPFASEVTQEEADIIFQELKKENEKMETHSECFQRAHMWSLRLDRLKEIKTEKVFLFFTRKFEMQRKVTSRWGRPIIWWFHVAPAVRVNGELVVMDATFSQKAESVQDWAKSLMKNPEECVELVNVDDYVQDRNSSGNQQCYYTSTPQYTYAPVDLGLSEVKGKMTSSAPKTIEDWLPHTLNWALESYSRSYRKEVRNTLKF
jgi:hypothetical protein